MKKIFLLLLLSLIFFIPFVSTLHAEEKNLQVTATVPAGASDLEIDISASQPQNTELSENDEVTFTLSYRSQASADFPLTLVGSWESGEIEGSGGSQVEVYDYVIGSASQADDGTIPVVNLVNKTITWNIPSLASSASFHTVTFKLRVKSTLPTTSRIEVYTNVDAEFGGATIPQEEYKLYVKSAAVTVTPTSIPGPTATPGPSSVTSTPSTPSTAITPSRQPTVIPFIFSSIEIDDISNDSATISVQTSLPSRLNVSYGECSTRLSQQIQVVESATTHEITLLNLEPNTDYCFQIRAIDPSSQRSITSDIFIIHTATEKENLNLKDAIIMWNNISLNNESYKKLVIPTAKTIVISFKAEDPSAIGDIKGSFQKKNVLGANTMTQPNIEQAPFIEVAPGIFSAEIRSPQQKGSYIFELNITDEKGSYSRKELPIEFIISNPLTVLNAQTAQPIENASITIMRYEESNGRWRNFKDSFNLIYQTDMNGELDIILPVGRYKLTVEAIGYEPLTQELSLGIDALEYPTMKLNPAFSLQTHIQYIEASFIQTFNSTSFFARNFFVTQAVRTTFLTFQWVFLLMMLVFSASHSLAKNTAYIRFLIILLSILNSLIFLIYQQLVNALPFIIITIIILCLQLFNRKRYHV